MEMIERVARAIEPETFLLPRINLHRADYDRAFTKARAALTELRIPTAAMLAASNRNNHPRDIDTWQTMIDVALGEKR